MSKSKREEISPEKLLDMFDQGYTKKEAAESLEVSTLTIERKLKEIRQNKEQLEQFSEVKEDYVENLQLKAMFNLEKRLDQMENVELISALNTLTKIHQSGSKNRKAQGLLDHIAAAEQEFRAGQKVTRTYERVTEQYESTDDDAPENPNEVIDL